MRDRELDAAIAAANPVGRERAAVIALPADRAALLEAVTGEPPAGSGPGRRRRASGPALLVVAVLAVALLGGVFTTPGRAVTDWVGERLGLGGPGEPGGPPALRQLNESWDRGTDLDGVRKSVLIVGPVTGHRHSRYEFITYRPARRPDRPTWPRGPCFELDLTQMRSMSSQGCGTLPKGGEFAFANIAGGYGHAYRDEDGLRFNDELFYLSGRVGPKVASVKATVDGREIPVQLRPVPKALRERFRLGRPFSFFVGFFSGVARGGTVEVTARGADGAVLGHARKQMIDRVASKEMMCGYMLEELAHLPRPGREECRQALGRTPEGAG